MYEDPPLRISTFLLSYTCLKRIEEMSGAPGTSLYLVWFFFSSWETRDGFITGIMILLYYTKSKSTELFFALSTKNNGSI